MRFDPDATTTAFREVRLPKAAWTHQAHLAAGLWFVRHYGLAEARILVPAAIRRHNAAVGTVDTPTSGYHETLTQLYLSLIDGFVREWTGPSDYPTMAAAVAEALDDRRIPLRYYSEARLRSAEARAKWVEPDLISDPAAARRPGPVHSPPPEPSTGD